MQSQSTRCACECGRPVNPGNRFVHGHNTGRARQFIPCQQCGVSFAAQPWRIANGTRKFCSRACYYASFGSPEQRFWSHVDMSGGETACWPWLGSVGAGYGHWRDNSAHKHAWMMTRGTIPDGLVVRHRCPCGGNRLCCNPAHLDVGTYAQNEQDKLEDGRRRFGEAVHNAKLTEAKVIEIRALRRNGLSLGRIAAHIGVSKRTVLRCLQGETWGHVVG